MDRFNEDKENSTSWFLVITGLLILLISSFLYFIFSDFESTPKETKDEVSTEKPEQKKKDKKRLSGGKKKREISGGSQEKLPFSEYRKYLKGSSLIKGDLQCNKEYALVELIFLKKKKERIIPYKPEGISGMYLKGEKDLCGPYAISASEGDFRYLVKVFKDCSNLDCSGVRPGKIYTLTQAYWYERLNYKIKIPSEEELTFRKEFGELNGTKEDPVYRIPVLIGDVLETQDPSMRKSTSEMWTHKKLTVKNVPNVHDPEKNHRLQMRYYTSDARHTDIKKKKPGVWTVTVKLKEEKAHEMTGGTLMVYDFHAAEKKKESYIRLVGYVKNVRTNPVVLKGSHFENYRNREWIRKRIEIGSLMKKAIPDVFERWGPKRIMREGVFLYLRDKHFEKRKRMGYVNSSTITYKDGKYYTILEAPAGTYTLKFDDNVLVEKYKWPPK